MDFDDWDRESDTSPRFVVLRAVYDVEFRNDFSIAQHRAALAQLTPIQDELNRQLADIKAQKVAHELAAGVRTDRWAYDLESYSIQCTVIEEELLLVECTMAGHTECIALQSATN